MIIAHHDVGIVPRNALSIYLFIIGFTSFIEGNSWQLIGRHEPTSRVADGARGGDAMSLNVYAAKS